MSVRLTDSLVVASASEYSSRLCLMLHSVSSDDLAILYYDYSLTLGAEVDRFWRVGRCSFVNILFVLNRYLALLGAIPVCFEFFGDLPREVSPIRSLHHGSPPDLDDFVFNRGA